MTCAKLKCGIKLIFPDSKFDLFRFQMSVVVGMGKFDQHHNLTLPHVYI